MECAFSSFEFKVGKTGSKNLQLVLQHYCKTSRVDKRCWKFYHPRIEPVLQHSGCCRLRKLVAKSREQFCLLQQNLFVLRVILVQGKLVLQLVT